MSWRVSWPLGLFWLLMPLAGCDQLRQQLAPTVAKPATGFDESTKQGGNPVTVLPAAASEVVAQGTLTPLDGILPIMAPPGDRIAEVFVEVGDHVNAGDLLIELESRRAKEIELQVAKTKLAETRQRIDAEMNASRANLLVAELQLQQAETQLAHATENLRLAERSGGRLDLLKQAADLAQSKLDRLREASNDPTKSRLVSDSKLSEESLKISQTRAEYENAQSAATQSIETSKLAVEAGRQELEAAKMKLVAAEAASSLNSLEQQIELLNLQLETSRLVSPIDATVMSLDTQRGQATTTMPLMHLADTTAMTCVAEVNVADLSRLQVGQTALIESPALARTLSGRIQRIEQMIAAPQLPNPFPMAPVDRHTVDVVIQIDPDDVEAAAQRIALQVSVTIQSSPNTSSTTNEVDSETVKTP